MSPDKLAEIRGWLALDELSTECEHLDASLVGVLDRARDLAPFAWRFRHPGDDEPPPATEIVEALALAKDVVEEIRLRLPAAPR